MAAWSACARATKASTRTGSRSRTTSRASMSGPSSSSWPMARSYGDGFLILGDAAGYLNGARLKGIHLAIKSGMLAAQAAFHALLSGDYSAAQLREYDELFENSWARDELWSQRNFHQAFEYGQIAGMLNAGLGI